MQAVRITMEALPMLMYAVALITMTFAALIYIVEPELFESPFRAVWFCVVTVTTVGYGDYSPVTTAGITIVMILIVLGVRLVLEERLI
jgi:voltage-gated potassium channel